MGTRNLTSEMLAALDDQFLRPFYLVELEFITDTVRLSSLNRDIFWNSETWLGNGWFRGMSNIRENGEVQAQGIEIVLNGVPSALISAALGDLRQNSIGRLYVGLLNTSNVVIDDPYLLFEGVFDQSKINDSANSSSIALGYESHLSRLKKIKAVRYTDAYQRNKYPGDRGFEFAPSVANWKGFWGVKTQIPDSKKER